MIYIAYHRKDPIVFSAKTANGLILSRLECGINIVPQPKEDEEYIELENFKAVIFPYEIESDTKALILKIHKI